MPEILVLGNFVVDIIGKPFDALPERGKLSILDTLVTHPGGNGPNTAGALGRLGAKVSVAGRVGNDLYGRFLAEALGGWGVDTALVVRDPQCATGVTLVAVDSGGERSFIHHFGANAAFTVDDVELDGRSDVRFLHLASFFVLPAIDGESAAGLLRAARERGIATSLDVCWDRTGRWMSLLGPCLPELDRVIPSQDEAAALTSRSVPSEMAAALRDRGARAAIVKCGERGCYYSGPEGKLAVPAYEVDVRDTTGAGDCFIAGVLYGTARGWDLERTLRFANACGGLAVESVGGVAGMRPAAEVEEWARRQPVRSERAG
jgi:sugar/nucleoside kinase (ribokinase family)